MKEKDMKIYMAHSNFDKARAVYDGFKIQEEKAKKGLDKTEALLKTQKKMVLASHIKTIGQGFLMGTLTTLGIFAFKDKEIFKGIVSLVLGMAQIGGIYLSTREATDRAKTQRDLEKSVNRNRELYVEKSEATEMAKSRLIEAANDAGIPMTEASLAWSEEQ